MKKTEAHAPRSQTGSGYFPLLFIDGRPPPFQAADFIGIELIGEVAALPVFGFGSGLKPVAALPQIITEHVLKVRHFHLLSLPHHRVNQNTIKKLSRQT